MGCFDMNCSLTAARIYGAWSTCLQERRSYGGTVDWNLRLSLRRSSTTPGLADGTNSFRTTNHRPWGTPRIPTMENSGPLNGIVRYRATAQFTFEPNARFPI